MKLNYIVIPIIVFTVAALGSTFTSMGIDSGWYGGLIKPDWVPRGGVIGAVWSIIYALVTMAMLILWNRVPHDQQFKHIFQSFFFNGIMNAAWSYVFFVQRMTGVALIIAVMMWLSVIEIMYSSWSIKKSVTFLLLPYAAWLIVATTMNYLIWQAN